MDTPPGAGLSKRPAAGRVGGGEHRARQRCERSRPATGCSHECFVQCTSAGIRRAATGDRVSSSRLRPGTALEARSGRSFRRGIRSSASEGLVMHCPERGIGPVCVDGRLARGVRGRGPGGAGSRPAQRAHAAVRAPARDPIAVPDRRRARGRRSGRAFVAPRSGESRTVDRVRRQIERQLVDRIAETETGRLALKNLRERQNMALHKEGTASFNLFAALVAAFRESNERRDHGG